MTMGINEPLYKCELECQSNKEGAHWGHGVPWGQVDDWQSA